MRNFFLLALAGVIAQLVDGSLGMAYGVSSTTVLLAAGVAPALASAAVHMAEIGTTAVSGISHSSFGNVDWSKTNATGIFQRAIEKLSVFLERLSLRNEQRQGERFVVTYAKPLLEAPEPGEDYGYLESLCKSKNTKMLSVRSSALLTEGSAKAFQLTRI
jgi:hypothetical protein